MKKLVLLMLTALFGLSLKPAEKTWVAIGDSITYMNDHPEETGNRITTGYMKLVTQKLPGIRYINQGHNGWQSADIAKKIDSLGLVKADIYSIFLGTNDWWHGRPVGTINDYKDNTGIKTVYGSFRIIISKLRKLNKDASIILVTPMQRGDFVYLKNMKNNAWGSYKEKEGQTLEQVVAAVIAIGKTENLPVVDLYHTKKLDVKKMVNYKRLKDPATGVYTNYKYPAYISIPFNPATDEYPYPADAINMTYDGLHPSDKGYKVIADKLMEVMRDWNNTTNDD